MLTKTQVVALSKERGFYLKKSLGQNFLIDKNLRDKIVRLLALAKDDAVLEVGPGLGAFTEPLAEYSRRVWAVEKDRKLYSLASELLAGFTNLEFIHSDILEFDIEAIPEERIRAVGALPFYITSPIIEKMTYNKGKIEDVSVIVQKEVARRLAARPGEDDYGSFSLFAQYHYDIEWLLDIKKQAFFPEPKVDSSLIRLTTLPAARIGVRDEEMLFRVIRQAFSHRRKTVFSALSQKGVLGIDKGRVGSALATLGIDPNNRPEVLGLEDFARISEALVDISA